MGRMQYKAWVTNRLLVNEQLRGKLKIKVSGREGRKKITHDN